MSRRRRADNPVSLFPFVAVMASTMGALILLLLVTARQASKARDAAWLAKQRSTAPLPELPPLPGKAAFPELTPLPPQELPPLVDRVLPALPPLTDPRSAIVARKEQIERELAELRKKRERTPKAGEERLAPLMREAALLRTRLERILDDRKQARRATNETQRTAEELAAEKQKAAERRKMSPNKYAVTPYFGPNGTTRRPIYLECTKDAVVLRPEGVSLPIAALEDDARADNPLARVVHAVSDYWTKRDPEPAYPLLIVRPEGVKSYYVARTALEFLRYPFGYELVAAERELAYPAADERVKRLAEAAMKEGRRSRAPLARGGGADGGTGTTERRGPPDRTALAEPVAPKREEVDSSAKPGGSQATRGRNAQEPADRGGDARESRTREETPRQRGGGDGGNGVVPAIMPPPEEPEEKPPEIGGSVRDFVARRQGPTGSRPGLGSLAALNPTPFERPSSDDSTNAGNGRGRRERSQARVDAEMERPRASLSERLQEMVQDAPIPLPTSKPQTQQWQPGLEGMERAPTADGGAAEAPSGVWSAGRPSIGRPPSAGADGWRGVQQGADESRAPDELIFSASSVGAQLENAANANGVRRGKRDPFDLELATPHVIERAIRCEVRSGSVVLENGQAIALDGDAQAAAAAGAVERASFKAVAQWPAPPHGSEWRPYVLLLVREGASENAYRLRGALTTAGVSVKQAWVDGHGVPTLVPGWGR